MNWYLNREMKAKNVLEFDIDYSKAYKLVKPQIEQLNKTALFEPSKKHLHLKDLPLQFFVLTPKWDSDITWVSAASKETFDFFDTCFKELEIAEKTKSFLNLDFDLIMYSGYFVVRSFGNNPNFHQDFLGSGINAFTLMTPIQIDDNATSGHLLYKTVFDTLSHYKYRKGKAIAFGSDFIHSTEPFKSDRKFIFLCFTYGCTDLDMWDNIKKTVASQGVSYRHPNGNIVITNPEFEQYFKQI